MKEIEYDSLEDFIAAHNIEPIYGDPIIEVHRGDILYKLTQLDDFGTWVDENRVGEFDQLVMQRCIDAGVVTVLRPFPGLECYVPYAYDIVDKVTFMLMYVMRKYDTYAELR